jgi:hypothetical protein
MDDQIVRLRADDMSDLTLKEFSEIVETLTPYQKKVLAVVERAPNQMADRWEIVRNGFAREWEEKPRAHGAMFRAILQAGRAMEEKGVVFIHPPKGQHGDYTLSSRREWCKS